MNRQNNLILLLQKGDLASPFLHLIVGMHLTISLVLLLVYVEPFQAMLKSNDPAEDSLEKSNSFLLHPCVKWMCYAPHELFGLGLNCYMYYKLFIRRLQRTREFEEGYGTTNYFQTLLPAYSRKWGGKERG